MMGYSILLTPLAFQELHEAISHFDQQRDGLGQVFLDDFKKAVQTISTTPFIFPKVYADKRRAVIRRFHYNVIYVVHDERVLVLAILHGARNPASWEKR